MKRSYDELVILETFEERFKYLQLHGAVGEMTFGGRRQLNQALYRSREWRTFRRQVILRDNGCDLGVEGYDIFKYAFIHHINPLTDQDIYYRHPCVFDLNNVITVSFETHQAIHYGDESLLTVGPVKREPNDTCPWKRGD